MRPVVELPSDVAGFFPIRAPTMFRSAKGFAVSRYGAYFRAQMLNAR